MRFSAAIQQLPPRVPAPERSANRQIERPQSVPQEPAARKPQEPPPDLDQRVRLSGEW